MESLPCWVSVNRWLINPLFPSGRHRFDSLPTVCGNATCGIDRFAIRFVLCRRLTRRGGGENVWRLKSGYRVLVFVKIRRNYPGGGIKSGASMVSSGEFIAWCQISRCWSCSVDC